MGPRRPVEGREPLQRLPAPPGRRVPHGTSRRDRRPARPRRGPPDADRLAARPPPPRPARPVGDPVQDHPADVVAGPGVLLAGVPEPDDDLHVPSAACRRDTPSGPDPTWTGLYPRWYPPAGVGGGQAVRPSTAGGRGPTLGEPAAGAGGGHGDTPLARRTSQGRRRCGSGHGPVPRASPDLVPQHRSEGRRWL
jgi:hypothetical protein